MFIYISFYWEKKIIIVGIASDLTSRVSHVYGEEKEILT